MNTPVLSLQAAEWWITTLDMSPVLFPIDHYWPENVYFWTDSYPIARKSKHSIHRISVMGYTGGKDKSVESWSLYCPHVFYCNAC